MQPADHPIHEIIRNRRSVKPALMDSEREVSRELIELLLENANWAPNHGHTEPWRFHIYTGSVRQRLADFLPSLYKDKTAPDQFRPEKFEKLGVTPLLAPVVIMICLKRGANPKIPLEEEMEAVACAVQNLHLTASAMGLGGFWSSPPVVYEAEMNAFLGLGKADRCLGLFYVGWPKEGEVFESSRRPIAEKTAWVDEQ
ncbi:MAG: nitroreductase [Verrucomicrobiota bacterium]